MTDVRRIDATCHFDLPTALQMALAAELVYAAPQIVERTAIRQWNATHFRFFDVESTQCFVAADQDTIIVCFRGTESSQTEDWMVDLDFDLVKGPMGGRVHEGFYNALSCVWHLLDQEVRQLQANGKRRLWVTGHSLGAALAAVAVARWRDADRPVAGLYTFGQPRTGDREFARTFDFAFRPHTFRIVNNHDIVTRTPPRSLGYRHLGTFVYFTENGELDCDVSWWEEFLNSWHGAIETILNWGGGGVEDHSMVLYRERLERLVSRQTGRSATPGHSPLALPHEPTHHRLVRPRRRAA